MGFDLNALTRAIEIHGTVARVVIADIAGSSPREVGASMLVWQTPEGLGPGKLGPDRLGPDGFGQSGTIGGGALEFQAAQRALSQTGFSRHALGPELGQCCGGAVTLLCEHFTAQDLKGLTGQEIVARGTGDRPLAVQRLLDRARARGQMPAPQLVQGWMIEPIEHPRQDLWIWGAGHVGRALIDTLQPLPDFAITWVDTGPERFPDHVPDHVTKLPAASPALVMAHAPKTATHLILTYSHELDFQLCHGALNHGFSFAGLIGSATKKARFRKRLSNLGHSDAQIDRINCPIGQKSLGKHPQAIAIGVAAQLVTLLNREDTAWTTHSSVFRA